MTLTVHNLNYLSESIRELYGLGFRSFSIIPDADCGTWTQDTFREYESQMDQVIGFWHAQRDISVNTIDQVMRKLVTKREPSHLCQAGKHIVGITIHGDIYPCHDFAGRYASNPVERAALVIGNVMTGFTKKQHEYADLRIDETVKPDTGYDCKTCWAKWVCSRGCPYMNYASSHDIRRVNATYCMTTRINASLAMRWMSVLDDFRFASAKTDGRTDTPRGAERGIAEEMQRSNYPTTHNRGERQRTP
ncbi:MAG: SPASM domain-containing protein, partial [Acidobacteriaceae bacterium]|nr:SPASM domain-containing protein [Acidobacteriaceae bacterium]